MSTRDLPLEAFIPTPDIRERFYTTIHAPAWLVMQTAREFDLQSLPPVRPIFRLRELLMRATPPPRRRPLGLLAETTGLGWGVLIRNDESLLVRGSDS